MTYLWPHHVCLVCSRSSRQSRSFESPEELGVRRKLRVQRLSVDEDVSQEGLVSRPWWVLVLFFGFLDVFVYFLVLFFCFFFVFVFSFLVLLFWVIFLFPWFCELLVILLSRGLSQGPHVFFFFPLGFWKANLSFGFWPCYALLIFYRLLNQAKPE